MWYSSQELEPGYIIKERRKICNCIAERWFFFLLKVLSLDIETTVAGNESTANCMHAQVNFALVGGATSSSHRSTWPSWAGSFARSSPVHRTLHVPGPCRFSFFSCSAAFRPLYQATWIQCTGPPILTDEHGNEADEHNDVTWAAFSKGANYTRQENKSKLDLDMLLWYGEHLSLHSATRRPPHMVRIQHVEKCRLKFTFI